MSQATTKPQTPAAFFFEHAGWSYTPGKETAKQGRWRCARALATAEREGSKAGFSFEWEYDGMTSADWTDAKPAWATWECVCRNVNGKTRATLCGVDFGRGGQPWDNPCRRVVEAELASEALDRDGGVQ